VMMSCEPDSAHLMRRCPGRRATLTPRSRMVLRQCVFQHRDADPDGLRSWVEVRRTIIDVSCRSSWRPVHHGSILPPIPGQGRVWDVAAYSALSRYPTFCSGHF
jgi:hypothetical protein